MNLKVLPSAVSGENYVQLNASTIVPDLARQRVNRLRISDSIIFWTNSNSEEDFHELVAVCHSFLMEKFTNDIPLAKLSYLWGNRIPTVSYEK